MNDDWPTTRRFPRQLSEAFLCDARSAIAIERTKKTRWVDTACWVVAIVLLALLASAAMRVPGH